MVMATVLSHGEVVFPGDRDLMVSLLNFYDYTTVNYSPYEDNFVDAYDNGFNSNTNVSVQGANDTSSFYTSLSYKYADGNTPNNSFERISFLGKASHKISRMWKLKLLFLLLILLRDRVEKPIW